jgi:hypothetical protein
MVLNQYSEGAIVRTGEGFRNRRIMPFALNAYIDSFDVFVGEDTSLPKDKQSQANLMLTLAGTQAEDGLPMVDRQTVLETLQIENRDQIAQRLGVAKQQAQAIEQMGQQLEQAQQVIQQLQGELQKSGATQTDAQTKLQIKQMGIEADLMKQKMRDESSNVRESERTKQNTQDNATKLLIENKKLAMTDNSKSGNQKNEKISPVAGE